MQIISIVNQKGGVSKTTTAQNLGGALKSLNHRVLLIDLDGQGTLTDIFNGDATKETIFEVMRKKANLIEAIQKTQSGDLLCSSSELMDAETIFTKTGKEYLLKEALNEVRGYDYIVIDTPPALSVLTINALTASDRVIITTQADMASLRGISQVGESIKSIKQYFNPKLKIDGILITRYNDRIILNQNMLNIMKERASKIRTKLFTTTIRECVAIREAQAIGQSLYEYAPESNGAKDYLQFAKELIQQED